MADVRTREALEGDSSVGNSTSPGYIISMRLVGADPNARVSGTEPLAGHSNYFIGSDPTKWRTNVPNYSSVKYENVYSGVDLVYYGSQSGQLEYDFVVAPGADPMAIAIQAGATAVVSRQFSEAGEDGKPASGNRQSRSLITSNGDLVIRTAHGEVRFLRPVVYQVKSTVKSRESRGGMEPTAGAPANRQSSIENRQFLEGAYVLRAGNQVGFEVPQYDHSKTLIIDPVLTYSTYLGGSGFDYAYGIAVDSSGSAYLTGQTDSTDFPLVGSVQSRVGGMCKDPLGTPYTCFDSFVAKLDPSGTSLVYSTYLGGQGDDHGTGIAVDSAGNAYVTGYTISTDFPAVNALQPAFGGGICNSGFPCIDGFVAKLSPAGSALLYSTYLGGTGSDIPSGIAVDASGAAYVVGSTSSTNFPVTSQPIQGVFGGGLYNAFITKINPAGSAAVYSTYLGGSGEDHGAAVAVDSSGEALVTGYTISSNFPIYNPLQGSPGGGKCGMGACFDAFVSKLNAAGSAMVYSTYFGGSGGDYGYGIASDAAGNAYVTGLTTSTDLPVTSGSFLTTGSGTSYDAYVMKLNASGSSMIYSTYLGGRSSEAGNAIAVDALGNAYVTGYAYGQGFPIATPLQALNVFTYDAFVTKLNAPGSALIFSTYLGGNGIDMGQGIAVDAARNVYVTGGTFSTDFPVTPGALTTVYGGGAYNAFVAKISGLSLPVASLSTTNLLFAGQGVSTKSLPSTVTMTNNGDSALSLASITASGDFAVTNDCDSGVLPRASCALSITFTPADFATRLGTVTIVDNAWGSPHVISLAGNGVPAPVVSLSPSSISFGPQTLNSPSSPHRVTLANTGSGTLSIASISATGEFAQTNDCPSVVYSGEGCTIQITFSPNSTGTFAGQLTISDNAFASPHIVPLNGTGLAPVIKLSTASLSFGNSLMGTSSAPQAVILTNSGPGNLVISSIVAGGDFSQTSNCLSPMVVGAGCEIDVTFSPSGKGPRKNSITISDNAVGSPHCIVVTGGGVTANMSPANLIFPDQLAGTMSAPKTVALTNAGSTVLNLWQFAVLGAQRADFSILSGCGAALEAGKSCAISVTFIPSMAASETATLLASNDGGGSPQAISLMGTGVASQPAHPLAALGSQAVSTSIQVPNVFSPRAGDVSANFQTLYAFGLTSKTITRSERASSETRQAFMAAFPLLGSSFESTAFLRLPAHTSTCSFNKPRYFVEAPPPKIKLESSPTDSGEDNFHPLH